jgi:hypothetical protein
MSQHATITDKSDDDSFGWSELIAAALAVGLTLALPSPGASATLDDEDWNFLWVKPAADLYSLSLDDGAPIDVAGTVNLALHPFTEPSATHAPRLSFADTIGAQNAFSHQVAVIPIGARTMPSATVASSLHPGLTLQPSVALREDRWTMVDVDGIVRLTAYARGPLDADDTAQIRTPTSFPRGLGTGVGVVTSTAVYVGATVKTDRSIYDIDLERFDGARWSTSVFMGADTTLGPVYVGATQDARGTRSAYLYLGRWF